MEHSQHRQRGGGQTRGPMSTRARMFSRASGMPRTPPSGWGGDLERGWGSCYSRGLGEGGGCRGIPMVLGEQLCP